MISKGQKSLDDVRCIYVLLFLVQMQVKFFDAWKTMAAAVFSEKYHFKTSVVNSFNYLIPKNLFDIPCKLPFNESKVGNTD